LGLIGKSDTVDLTDIPTGEYRATLVNNPALISLGIGASRTLEVTAISQVPEYSYEVGDVAEGNFLDEAISGVMTE
jgi:hypothetical protein